MRVRHFPKCLLASAGAFSLTACGGGGSTGTSFISSAPVTPTPPAPSETATVKIFGSPVPGEYSSVGVSTNDTLSRSVTDRLMSISTADADQAHIRYNSAGYYEIQLPGAQWDRLVPYKGLANPEPNNNYFQPASVAQNFGYLVTSNSRDLGYTYSELGSWGNRNLSADHGFGSVAFGSPTSAGSVPISGTASYSGIVSGTVDIMNADSLFGGYYPTPAGGTVTLTFDLGAGTLGGSMALSVNGGMSPIPVGTFAFTNTVFSAGSTTYSGRFDSAAAGANYFLGRFTGPAAQETIGAWALPFVYSGDGQTHQAIGAWIAKNH